MKKTILETVYSTAQGLHKANLIDIKTMREFDALCLQPVKMYSAAQIKRIRLRNKVSQGVFAAFLNTSASTVQKWESGAKKPGSASLKLLNIVDNKGIEILA